MTNFGLRGNTINSWFISVLDYFRFVAARKVSRKHKLLPDGKLLLAIFLTLAVGVSLLHTFADPFFIKWFSAESYHKSGWFALTTDLGKSNWLLLSTGSVIFFMSFYKDERLTVSHMVRWHHIFLKFYFVFTTIALSGMLAVLLKNLIGRARPLLYNGSDLWYSVPFEGIYKYASFPSGHATTAGAFMAAIYFLNRRWGMLLLPVALWVVVSRVMVGAHYPSDVLAGMSLGVIFAWIYARSFARKRLLFEYDSRGRLRLRNAGAKRARRKARRLAAGAVVPGLGKELGVSAPDKV